MPQVEYIGLKERKVDNVAGTGLVWIGQGDIKDVPEAAWAKMALHPDVWRLAPQPGLEEALGRKGIPTKPDPGTTTRDPGAKHKYVLEGADGSKLVLDTMKTAELRAFVKDKLEPAGVGKDIDLRLSGEKLQQAIYDAIKAASKAVGASSEG